jgi:hypothetical protein
MPAASSGLVMFGRPSHECVHAHDNDNVHEVALAEEQGEKKPSSSGKLAVFISTLPCDVAGRL